MTQQLHGIALQAFRNYSQWHHSFDNQLTVFVGPNAVGKTSILEAIKLIHSGDSFRAGRIEEMIAFGNEVGRVKAKLPNDELEIVLTTGEVQGKRTRKRLYSINGAGKRKKDFTHKFATVLFRPEDMRLIEGSPSRRRSFLDDALQQTNPKYAHATQQYDKALRRRNKVLEAVRENRTPETALHYWNQTMLKNGVFIQEQRRQFLSTFAEVSFPVDFTVTYDPSLITEERQQEYQRRAIAAGHTLIGPHKDDFIVELHDWRQPSQTKRFDVAKFGSRGQQRLAVLWLKTAQLHFIEQQREESSLLLLDDIFSELDEESRDYVWQLCDQRQVIMTTAQPELFESPHQNVSFVELG